MIPTNKTIPMTTKDNSARLRLERGVMKKRVPRNTRIKPVWITKYAATKGIIRTWAVGHRASEDDLWRVEWDGSLDGYHWFPNRFVHSSKKAAMAHAFTIRAKKLEAIRRQIAKLELPVTISDDPLFDGPPCE